MKKLVSLLLLVALCCCVMCSASASQEQARYYQSAVVGMHCSITQNGVVKAAPDVDAQMCGRVYEGEYYLILGYAQSTSDWRWWFLIEYQDGYYGWVGAAMADVSNTFCSTPAGEGFCVITGSGVHGKSGPGTNYAKVATCDVGNGFRVWEIRRGNTGKNWYRIEIQGVSCWISSGLCRFYPY